MVWRVSPKRFRQIPVSARPRNMDAHAPDRALKRIHERPLGVADEAIEPRPRVGFLLLLASRPHSCKFIVREHGGERAENERVVQVREKAQEDGHGVEFEGYEIGLKFE